MTDRTLNGWRYRVRRILVRRTTIALRWRLEGSSPAGSPPSVTEEAAMAARVDMLLRFIELQQSSE